MNKQQNMMVGAPLRLFYLKTTTLPVGNSNSRSPLRRGFLLVALALASLALSPTAQAITPAPDGGYPGQNTAEGEDALFSNTTGANNTAVGFNALHSLATGSQFPASEATAVGSLALFNDTTGYNTAFGFKALYSNTDGFANVAIGRNAMLNHTTGDHNTATGGAALLSNTDGTGNTATGRAALANGTTGSENTATGWQTLFNNIGDDNTADGAFALFHNTTGVDNAANGAYALYSNTTGGDNTANGVVALISNTTGSGNTANGEEALYYNTTGDENVADGAGALESNTTGSGNIAMGFNAGINLTNGNNNIDIGNAGAAHESNTIRIGRTPPGNSSNGHTKTFIAGIYGVAAAQGVAVYVNSSGQLGTKTSSERFKDEIKPMDKASEAILALHPVTFRYKHELDPEGIPQFGLVAEQVEKVNPDLVARDAQGKVYTVRYEAVNAMLLNEFLKQHRKVEEQAATIAKQQKQIEALATGLQKVSDELVLSKPPPQMVSNNQ